MTLIMSLAKRKSARFQQGAKKKSEAEKISAKFPTNRQHLPGYINNAMPFMFH